MIDTRLILLEGMPSVGKTTNARFLQIQLEGQGVKTEWVHEVAMPQPVLFFDEAGFTHEEYGNFKKEYPSAAEILDQISVARKHTVCVDLNLIQWYYQGRFDPAAYEALLRFDVWKFPIERYERFALDKWQAFALRVLEDKGRVYIVDSALFQYQIFRFLFENRPYEELRGFVGRLEEILRPLRPSLLFLYRENTEATIDYLEKDRGASYLDYLYQRDKNQPYYRDKPCGAEGFKAFLRDYGKAAGRLFRSFGGNKLSLEISKGDWPCLEDEMLSFLGLGRAGNIEARPPEGLYKNSGLGYTIKIQGLFMTDPNGTKRKLTPKSQNEFYVDWLPVVLRFDNGGIVLAGSQICDRWSTTGMRYEKVDAG